MSGSPIVQKHKYQTKTVNIFRTDRHPQPTRDFNFIRVINSTAYLYRIYLSTPAKQLRYEWRHSELFTGSPFPWNDREWTAEGKISCVAVFTAPYIAAVVCLERWLSPSNLYRQHVRERPSIAQSCVRNRCLYIWRGSCAHVHFLVTNRKTDFCTAVFCCQELLRQSENRLCNSGCIDNLYL